MGSEMCIRDRLKRCQEELGEVEGRLAELRLDDAEDLVKDEN